MSLNTELNLSRQRRNELSVSTSGNAQLKFCIPYVVSVLPSCSTQSDTIRFYCSLKKYTVLMNKMKKQLMKIILMQLYSQFIMYKNFKCKVLFPIFDSISFVCSFHQFRSKHRLPMKINLNHVLAASACRAQQRYSQTDVC